MTLPKDALEWPIIWPVGQRWLEHAACVGTDTAIFFVRRGEPARQALAICARCPVRPECLEFALVNDERFGIWGGTTETRRRRMRRAPPTSAAERVTAMDKLLLTAEEVADMLGIGRTKVYELLASRAARVVKIGNCRRIPVQHSTVHRAASLPTDRDGQEGQAEEPRRRRRVSARRRPLPGDARLRVGKRKASAPQRCSAHQARGHPVAAVDARAAQGGDLAD